MPVPAPATPACAAAPEASSGQRGWNRQPAGIRVGSGGSPASTGHLRYEAEVLAFALDAMGIGA